jgi:hypothetical protein
LVGELPALESFLLGFVEVAAFEVAFPAAAGAPTSAPGTGPEMEKGAGPLPLPSILTTTSRRSPGSDSRSCSPDRDSDLVDP